MQTRIDHSSSSSSACGITSLFRYFHLNSGPAYPHKAIFLLHLTCPRENISVSRTQLKNIQVSYDDEMQISDTPNDAEEDGECRRAPLLRPGWWRMFRFFVSTSAGLLPQIYKKLTQVCNIFSKMLTKHNCETTAVQ